MEITLEDTGPGRTSWPAPWPPGHYPLVQGGWYTYAHCSRGLSGTNRSIKARATVAGVVGIGHTCGNSRGYSVKRDQIEGTWHSPDHLTIIRPSPYLYLNLDSSSQLDNSCVVVGCVGWANPLQTPYLRVISEVWYLTWEDLFYSIQINVFLRTWLLRVN